MPKNELLENVIVDLINLPLNAKTAEVLILGGPL